MALFLRLEASFRSYGVVVGKHKYVPLDCHMTVVILVMATTMSARGLALLVNSVDSHGRSNTRDFEIFELIPFSGSI